MLDRERSLALAQKLVNRIEPSNYYTPAYQPQRCWYNAIKAMRLYHKHLAGAVYIEGWCAMPDISFVQPHGWIELEDGTILDLTYVYTDYEDGTQKQYEYFPALRYTVEELKGVRTDRLPIVEKRAFNGAINANTAYRIAYEKAYASIGIDITTTYTEVFKNRIASTSQ